MEQSPTSYILHDIRFSGCRIYPEGSVIRVSRNRSDLHYPGVPIFKALTDRNDRKILLPHLWDHCKMHISGSPPPAFGSPPVVAYRISSLQAKLLPSRGLWA